MQQSWRRGVFEEASRPSACKASLNNSKTEALPCNQWHRAAAALRCPSNPKRLALKAGLWLRPGNRRRVRLRVTIILQN